MNHHRGPADTRPADVLTSVHRGAETDVHPHPIQSRAVNRAIGDMRRGVAVLLLGAGPVVILPIETATETTLAEFRAASSGNAFVLMAAGRARALPGLDGVLDQGVVALNADRGAELQTLQALANPSTDIGHAPVRASIAVTLPFTSHDAEAALALAKLARLLPAVLAAPASADAAGFDLLSVTASDLLDYPAVAASGLSAAASAVVPLAEAHDTRIVAFRPPDGGIEHIAIIIGHPENAEAPLVRVHSECFTGDLLGSMRCDCGPQLHQAIRLMEQEGAGIVLYMAQEGRGIGLVNKLRAYELQDRGLDTLDANSALGYGADERSFAAASVMLAALNISRVRLLTNNPDKVASLQSAGIEVVGRVSHAIEANGVNDFYLDTKARRFGHLLG